MSQAYSDPKRASDPHALPDVDVFYHVQGERVEPDAHDDSDDSETSMETGWYWWNCFPGCLPDSDPIGPFATEAEALADAQEESE